MMYPRMKQLIRRRIALLVTLLALCQPMPVPAQPDAFARGLRALENNDPYRAYQLWEPLAKQGDPNAQFGLGLFYYDGIFVPQSYEEANYWFLLAADQGFAPAQYNMGNAYSNGLGVAQNDEMAVHWWRQAADQGFSPAQYNLATALMHGRGVEKDEAAALELYRQAAEADNPMAVEMLKRYREASEALSQATPAPESDAGSPPRSCMDWLSSAEAGSYSIQLMTASRQSTIADLQQRYPELHPVACAYDHEGATWFVVMHGRYPDRQTARRQLEQLPQPLRDQGAYVRSLNSVRKLIGE